MFGRKPYAERRVYNMSNKNVIWTVVIALCIVFAMGLPLGMSLVGLGNTLIAYGISTVITIVCLIWALHMDARYQKTGRLF